MTPKAPSPAGARRVAHNAVVLAVATLLARLGMFALGVVLARGLGVEDYGRYGLGVALAAIVVPLTDLGASPYVAREVARSREVGEAQLAALARGRLLSALVGNVLVLAAVVAVVPDGRTTAAIALALLAGACDGLAQFAFGYYQGLERMGFQARLTTATALARATGGIVLALLTGSLMVVLVWLLAVGLVQSAVAARELVGPARRAARTPPAWRTVFAMGAVAVLVVVVLRADTVLLGALQGEEDVGQYTAAWTLMAGLQILPWTISVALGPVFARTFAADRAAFARAWREGLRVVLVVGAPIAVVVSVLAAPAIDRLFGAEYAPAAGALAIVVWAVPAAAMSSVATLALRGAGREDWLLRVLGAAAAANLLVNLWAIPAYGIDGAAAVNVATELLIVGAITGLVVTRGIAPVPHLLLVRLVGALGVAGAVAYVLRDPVPVEVAGVAAAGAYAAVALATRLVTVDELRALRRR